MSNKVSSGKNKITVSEEKTVQRLKQEMSFLSTYKNTDVEQPTMAKQIDE